MQAINMEMLHNLWNDFNYSVDVCHVAHWAPIAGL